MTTKTAELAGRELDDWVAKALGEEPARPTVSWPNFDRVQEREAIHVAPMAGKNFRWCAVVVGRPGGRLPEGKGGWMEGVTPREAMGTRVSRRGMAAMCPMNDESGKNPSNDEIDLGRG